MRRWVEITRWTRRVISGAHADKNVSRVDANTGEVVRDMPTKKFAATYGSAMSADGRYFGGGAWPRDGLVVADTQDRRGLRARRAARIRGPARGEFDPDRQLLGRRARRHAGRSSTSRPSRSITNIAPDALYCSRYYSANADRNGEVWAGRDRTAGRYARFNPKLEASGRNTCCPSPTGSIAKAGSIIRPRP